jgi:hypothetical protein
MRRLAQTISQSLTPHRVRPMRPLRRGRGVPALMLGSALALGGCIDADVSMDFSDGETMQGAFVLTMARQLYDMTAANKPDFCKDGTTKLTEESFHCATTRVMTLEEVLAKGTVALGEGDIRPEEGLQIERIDENRIRVSLDFSKMPQQDEAPDTGGMAEMLRAAVAGHSFTFRVRGYRILATTGDLSEDETEAVRVIPVAAFLDTPPSLGGAFVTDVQLKQQCRFWVFCD